MNVHDAASMSIGRTLGEADFEWADTLSVGVAAIDGDHKAFFELACLLHTAMRADAERAVVASALGMLDEYVLGHFHREEKAMIAVGYPQTGEHQEAHRKFQAEAHAAIEAYQRGAPEAAANLPGLVNSWLRQHIAHDDTAYAQWINDAVVDSRPLAFLAMEAEDEAGPE